MIIPDINLLLYAYDAESPFHAKAVAWWEAVLSGSEPVGLPLVVLFGFMRVGTSPRAFLRPMSVAEAAGHVRGWLAQPNVEVLTLGLDHANRALALLESARTAGNLVTDAQIAAAAIEHNAVVQTNDTDFVRFGEVRWFNPISGTRSRSVRKSPR